MRPTWDQYGLGMAQAASVRGDCTRRKVGAVILDRRHRIIGAGYNGSYPGGPSCLAGQCPRGRHYRAEDWSVREYVCGGCGEPWPCSESVPPGSSYDTGPGSCHAVHAEANALLDVDNRARMTGATLYITTAPCDGCMRLVRATGITMVVWPESRWMV